MSRDGIARLERLRLVSTKRGLCGDDVLEHAILVVRPVRLAVANQTGLSPDVNAKQVYSQRNSRHYALHKICLPKWVLFL